MSGGLGIILKRLLNGSRPIHNNRANLDFPTKYSATTLQFIHAFKSCYMYGRPTIIILPFGNATDDKKSIVYEEF